MVHGLIKRIGNGETTNIWSENWILGENMKRPLTSLMPAPPSKVSELINSTTSSWNEQLVRSIFISIDAEAVFAIPLFTWKVECFWAWSEDRRGIFIVRSAYKMV